MIWSFNAPGYSSIRKQLNIHALFAAVLVGLLSSGNADVRFALNVDDVQTTSFDGWGVSLAWWANAFGEAEQSDALADLCFTMKTLSLEGAPVPGLGLNIVRYNIGASPGPESTGPERLAHLSILPHRRIPAFANAPTTSGSAPAWNWIADASQRNMLQKAVSRGADTVEFFSDSPPWWMCTN